MTPFDFPLKDLSGESRPLRSLLAANRLNLLVFYNNDCLGCTGRALPLAYELQKTYRNLNLIVIHSFFGSRPITNEEIKGVFTSKEPPFPIYLDNGHALFENFGCAGTPHWILLNGNFREVQSIFGSQENAQLKLDLAIREYLDNPMDT